MKLFIFIYLVFVSSLAWSQYKGLGVESISSETIKKFAPPKLNPEMANKLKKMFDITSPGMGMLSSDKKTLYFTWRVTGQSQIWKIQGANTFPTQLTSGIDSVTLSGITPDGKYLIISKDVNGQENPGLFKLDTKTGSITEIYRKEKVQVSLAFITEDSKYIFITANDVKADSYNTYKVDLQTFEKTLIFEGNGNWYVADQKNDGKKLLLVHYSGARINEYYEWNESDKKLIPVIGKDEKNEYEVNFAAADQTYFVNYAKDNFKRIYFLDLRKDKKELKMISDPKINFDVAGFSLDFPRKKLLYNINRNGYTELYAMDAKTFKNISIPKFPNADHVFNGMTTKDGQVTMLGIISSQSPRVSYSYNWSTKKLQQWVLPSAPEVDLSTFVVAKLDFYKAKDQTQIPMFVYGTKQCLETKQCPVVVHFHGGPEGQSIPGFNTLAQAFVNEGFVFVEPNVRGSDGYGKEWIDLDNGPKRENVITDIEDAALWIKTQWKNNSGQSPKVGVMGWSYGGYSTLLAMSRFAGQYDAGVALVGMSNLISFLNNTAPYRRVLRISEYGDPEKDKDALIKLSPITYVSNVKSPLMIIQGANDPRVPVGEALQFHETLLKNKISSELIIFADEGHGSSKKENQVLEIGNTIEFFKKNLK